jgi:dynein heavy chain
VDEIKQVSEKYTKVINKCSKKLPTNPILDKFRVLLKTFKDAMPVVIALSNKVVQEDELYWGEIQRIVNKKFIIDGSFTLKDMIDMNFHDFQN